MPEKQPAVKERASAVVTGAVAVLGVTYLVYTKLPAHQRRNIREAISAKLGGLGQQGVKVRGGLDYSDLPVYGGIPKRIVYPYEPTVLTNKAYAGGDCYVRKCPIWAAYRAFAVANPTTYEGPSRFSADDRLSVDITHGDYTGSGYDRGHMASNRIIARCYGREAQLETFLMSNVCPQSPALNQHVW